jgi:hypothetical protein
MKTPGFSLPGPVDDLLHHGLLLSLNLLVSWLRSKPQVSGSYCLKTVSFMLTIYNLSLRAVMIPYPMS